MSNDLERIKERAAKTEAAYFAELKRRVGDTPLEAPPPQSTYQNPILQKRWPVLLIGAVAVLLLVPFTLIPATQEQSAAPAPNFSNNPQSLPTNTPAQIAAPAYPTNTPPPSTPRTAILDWPWTEIWPSVVGKPPTKTVTTPPAPAGPRLQQNVATPTAPAASSQTNTPKTTTRDSSGSSTAALAAPDPADQLPIVGRTAAPPTAQPADPPYKAIQAQLARIGCLPGPADGVWGLRSEAALRRFNEATEQDSAGKPGTQIMAILSATPDNECQKLCSGNNVLTEQGCRPRVQRSTPRTTRQAPASNCYKFNGRDYCL